jgi:hypothetical protein
MEFVNEFPMFVNEMLKRMKTDLQGSGMTFTSTNILRMLDPTEANYF